MALTTLQQAMSLLNHARNATTGLLADIPQDKLTHQPVPGANHALWILGHLAYADDLFTPQYDGLDRQLDESHDKLFGQGSTPVNDLAAYPTIAEIRSRFDAARDRLASAIQNAGDAKLAEPVSKDFESFASTKMSLISSIAWHEGIHAGQITVIRKSLNMGLLFG